MPGVPAASWPTSPRSPGSSTSRCPRRERTRSSGCTPPASRYTEINAKWHRRARVRHPDWPEVPDEAYQALAGALRELVRSWVSAGKTEALGELEDILVALHLAVLAGRPWTLSSSPPDA